MTKEEKIKKYKEYLENDLFEFAKYINPTYVYGDIHERVFRWLADPNAKDHQLLLLPRAHLKSHCIAVWVAWKITREPWSTIVYLSAGEDLATNQVYAIKNMMTSDEYRYLWPEMINERDADRDKWSAWAINVDHPERKRRKIRDHTLIVKTVKSNAVGLHCSDLVLDDVVVPSFAYTSTGRMEVQRAVSQFASIKNPGATTKAVGTRYHPKDLYNDFINAKLPIFNLDTGELTGEEELWDVMEFPVEDSLDHNMFGNFLWPRTQDPHTEQWYGFDTNVLVRIRSQYDSTGQMEQFYAQYYNDPNDPESHRIDRSSFKYYEKKFLNQSNGHWYYNKNRLNIFAGMDVAWSVSETADFTAIAVIGIDDSGFIYVLELDRFKTSDYSEYYTRVMDLANYWGFRKLRVETNSGGKLVAAELERLIRQNGQTLNIEGKHAASREGSKFERHAAILEPRYHNGTILHFRGGLIPELEEEVVLERPRHDDLEDAVCAAIEISRPPAKKHNIKRDTNVVTNVRFGGRRR